MYAISCDTVSGMREKSTVVVSVRSWPGCQNPRFPSVSISSARGVDRTAILPTTSQLNNDIHRSHYCRSCKPYFGCILYSLYYYNNAYPAYDMCVHRSREDASLLRRYCIPTCVGIYSRWSNRCLAPCNIIIKVHVDLI